MPKKSILLIHTGGTISMAEDQSGAVVPGESNPVVEQSAQISDYADLIVEAPFTLPSPHITPDHMLQIKQLIEKYYLESGIDGVVVTHGTDTLEETAYFLDLTVRLSIPMVLTGAMRSSNEIGSDGLYNLISSVRVACSDEAYGKGVLVVLNDEIHTAVNVTKTHASNVSTFQSPQYGPIGIVTKGGVMFHHTPKSDVKYTLTEADKKVAILKAYAGMDSKLFSSLHDLGFDGVVIEALGQGNLPPDTIKGIKHLISKKIPVVLVSRCFNGIAQDVYGYDGGGRQLKELGVIFSNGLNGQKARLKLMIGLAQSNDHAFISRMFK
ncbi:asparaginase [Jeotgalibacillus proteolyticus]|uniref:asparaginase n=1 Tax=Jeotgalibacillus proteolyticus TaxID=2082395 RepID=A0A2S5GE12_9BACL|nr:asparaginase [Jeotgalibacillus proteolyticus]PPA71282.1 L-asparaginase [Jeotgalibacillus proteolyticus]